MKYLSHIIYIIYHHINLSAQINRTNDLEHYFDFQYFASYIKTFSQAEARRTCVLLISKNFLAKSQ